MTAVTYITRQGDTVDSIAWEKYQTTAGRVVEKLLDANPGLAAKGVILPPGIVVTIPVINPDPAVSQGVTLWT